jgi:phosphodiesterase/alkaline phosphatase D-like protein
MRRLLVGMTAVLLVASLGITASAAKQTGARGRGPHLDEGEFPYGVAAYDVKPTRANLWTETTQATKVRVEWSTDPAFGSIEGSVTKAVPDKHAGTVLTPAKDLTPNTRYYYRYVDTANGETSRTGTFLTAPDKTADVPFTFDISGDQDGTINPDTGKPCFNTFLTFKTVQADNPAFYINLGDTIYSDSKCKEQAGGIGDDVTLDQYRADHANQITYDNWRNLRGAVGQYSEWDDHEVRNDWDSKTEDPQLIKNGKQAFKEWEGVQTWDPKVGFYRTWTWGSNAEFFLLDERSFRTPEALRMDADQNGTPDCNNPETGAPDLAPNLNQDWRTYFSTQFSGSGLDIPPPAQCLTDLNAPDRTLLGAAQRKRFLKDLAASTATWKFVITEDQIQNYFALPYDRWEGYLWERDQVLHAIDDNAIKNVVWLATDVHAFMAHTVDYNTQDPGIGQTVQGMIEYSFGPVATDTFAVEINQALGNSQAAGKVRGFLVFINMETCAGINVDGYGRITVDPETHQLTISPRLDNGGPVGGPNGAYKDCNDYIAMPQ